MRRHYTGSFASLEQRVLALQAKQPAAPGMASPSVYLEQAGTTLPTYIKKRPEARSTKRGVSWDAQSWAEFMRNEREGTLLAVDELEMQGTARTEYGPRNYATAGTESLKALADRIKADWNRKTANVQVVTPTRSYFLSDDEEEVQESREITYEDLIQRERKATNHRLHEPSDVLVWRVSSSADDWKRSPDHGNWGDLPTPAGDRVVPNPDNHPGAQPVDGARYLPGAKAMYSIDEFCGAKWWCAAMAEQLHLWWPKLRTRKDKVLHLLAVPRGRLIQMRAQVVVLEGTSIWHSSLK